MKHIILVSMTAICLAFLSSCGSEVQAGLCNGCGQDKGSAECCADGAEVCDKCTKHKGSPGCCN